MEGQLLQTMSTMKIQDDIHIPSSTEERVRPPGLCSICEMIDWTRLHPYLETNNEYTRAGTQTILHDLGIAVPTSDKTTAIIRRSDGVFEETEHKGLSSEEIVWLGSLDDIQSRAATCKVCALFTQTLEWQPNLLNLSKYQPSYRSWSLSGEATDAGQERIFGVGFDDFADVTQATAKPSWNHGHDETTRWTISRATVFYKWRNVTGQAVRDAWQILRSTQAEKKSSDGTLNSLPTMMGRHVGGKCDTRLLRKWLNECREKHPECCSGPSLLPDSKIRLIDVKTQCLVDMSLYEASLTGYAALSYVWGKQPQRMMLHRSDLQRSAKPGYVIGCSATITDAIALSAQLDLPYIWVDALCIVQDDRADKEEQLPLMGSIYNGATLTIIAANGTGADAGLPGIGKDRIPLPHTEISDKVQLSCVPSAGRKLPLHESHWVTRGWTYQEHALSSRKLCCYGPGFFWECRRTKWYEELDLESPVLRSSKAMRTRWPVSVPSDVAIVPYYSRYAEHVTSFNLRNFGDENDMKYAFAGIQSRFFGTQFLWGLAEHRFERDLSWCLDLYGAKGDSIERRANNAPSWSWMAWRGPTELPEQWRAGNRRVAIVCYRWSKDGFVQISASQTGDLPVSNPSLSNEVLLSIPERDEPSPCEVTLDQVRSVVPLTIVYLRADRQIFFWSFCLRLQVHDTPPSIHPHEDASRMKIHASGEYDGYVNITNEANRPLSGSTQDFIVLHQRFPIADSPKYQIWDLMMVVWKGNVAERWEIGSIQCTHQVWTERLNLVWKLVVLA